MSAQQGADLGRTWERAVCSRPSSFVFRQKVPSTGQELPSHTSLSSAGSVHTSQKCLGPPVSDMRTAFRDVARPSSVIS